MAELTEKQRKFSDYYIESGNATQSYIDAGYKATTREVAEANARRLLGNDSVKNYVEDKQKKLQEKTEMNQEWVLMKYKDLIERCETTDPSVAKGALDSVAKHLGMFKERIEHTGGITLEGLLRQL